uniref:Uncharacterized protein n=1 Tax=Romanomermis culicivorax TaxID=13658 RepID=A0A915JAH3_ROMCU
MLELVLRMKESIARVLEKMQKENQETDKSVIPKEQYNVLRLYPGKEGEFGKPGTSKYIFKEGSSCKVLTDQSNRPNNCSHGKCGKDGCGKSTDGHDLSDVIRCCIKDGNLGRYYDLSVIKYLEEQKNLDPGAYVKKLCDQPNGQITVQGVNGFCH